MTEFKEGDVVRIVDDFDVYDELSAEGPPYPELAESRPEMVVVKIRKDEITCEVDCHNNNVFFFEKELEKVDKSIDSWKERVISK